MQFNTTVRNAWKLHDRQKDKWMLLYAKTPSEQDRWKKAFDEERRRVQQDKMNGKQCHLVGIVGTTILVPSHPCQVTATHLNIGHL